MEQKLQQETTAPRKKSYPYIAQSATAKRMFTVLQACVAAHVPIGLIGDPGISKTDTVKAVARATGRELVSLSLSTMPPEDVSGIPFPTKMTINDKEVPVAPYAMPPWEQAILRNPHSLLHLDEFDTAPPSTQHAFLQLIQNRILPGSSEPFSDDVAIVVTMNPAAQAGGSELSIPMGNRFAWYKFDVDYYDWKAGFLKGWESDEPMRMPEIITDPEDVAARLNRFRNLVVKYMESSAGGRILVVVPNGEEKSEAFIKENDQAGLEVFHLAFPSWRSWDNLARIACHIPEETDAGLAALESTVKGVIGFSQGLKFWKFYLDNRKNIDIDEMLRDPKSIDWKKIDVNSSEGIFISLLEEAQHGKIREVMNVYFAIHDAHADELLSGNRIKNLYSHDLFEAAKPRLSDKEMKELTNAYIKNFSNVLRLSR